MGWALWLQYGSSLEPCPLCVFQRIAVIAIGVVFLVARDPQSGPRAARRSTPVLTVIAAGIGAALAARHVWIQALPKGRLPRAAWASTTCWRRCR